MEKKLTRRQKQFLTQFLDAYREAGSPIHYGELADRLGISKVTTYEMLRLLEELDLISSQYEYPPEQRGPGRPSVVFLPTVKADQILEQSGINPKAIEEWNEVKDQLLRQLEDVKESGLEELLSYLLARLPDNRNPLVAVTEFTAAILITLFTLPKPHNINVLMEKLKKIGLPGEIGLSALTGVGLMLSGFDRVNQRISIPLAAHIGNYEELLSHLGKDNLLRISGFARDAIHILAE